MLTKVNLQGQFDEYDRRYKEEFKPQSVFAIDPNSKLQMVFLHLGHLQNVPFQKHSFKMYNKFDHLKT